MAVPSVGVIPQDRKQCCRDDPPDGEVLGQAREQLFSGALAELARIRAAHRSREALRFRGLQHDSNYQGDSEDRRNYLKGEYHDVSDLFKTRLFWKKGALRQVPAPLLM